MANKKIIYETIIAEKYGANFLKATFWLTCFFSSNLMVLSKLYFVYHIWNIIQRLSDFTYVIFCDKKSSSKAIFISN